MRKRCLKKLPKIDQNTVIGFLDETSPQTTANTQRLWSYGKPTICKNTAKIRANTFGFYALNGNSTIDYIGSAEGHESPDLQVGDEVNPRPFFVPS